MKIEENLFESTVEEKNNEEWKKPKNGEVLNTKTNIFNKQNNVKCPLVKHICHATVVPVNHIKHLINGFAVLHKYERNTHTCS